MRKAKLVHKSIRDACEESPVVARCRDQIVCCASMAGFRFNQDDIVFTQESDGTKVIFLRRIIVGYERDVDGNLMLDENSDPIPIFQPTAWVVYHDNCGHYIEGAGSLIVLPRLVVRYPWLFFIIKGDQVISDGVSYDGSLEDIVQYCRKGIL